MEATAKEKQHRMRDIGKTPKLVWGDALDDAAMRQENGWAGFGSIPALHEIFHGVDASSIMLRRNIM